MFNKTSAFDMVPPGVRDAAKKMSAELSSRGVPHAVIGGMAVSAYSPPRTTGDVDFLIPESFSSVAYEFQDDPTPISGMHLQGLGVEVDGHNVDLMFLPDDIPDSVLGEGTVVDGVPVVGPALLILLKMKSGRTKDVGDVVEILKSGADRKSVKRFLKQYAPDVVEDFDSTAMLADYESGRMEEGRRASIAMMLLRSRR